MYVSFSCKVFFTSKVVISIGNMYVAKEIF